MEDQLSSKITLEKASHTIPIRPDMPGFSLEKFEIHSYFEPNPDRTTLTVFNKIIISNQ